MRVIELSVLNLWNFSPSSWSIDNSLVVMVNVSLLFVNLFIIAASEESPSLIALLPGRSLSWGLSFSDEAGSRSSIHNPQAG